MSGLPPPAAAAHNNALWCDTVCRTHGLPTALDGAFWRCLEPAPPFYPNAVTLDPHAQETQVAQIAVMIASGLGEAWAVKDSFSALDLAPLGFAPLFEATWIGRPPGTLHNPDPRLRWEVVRDEEGLAAWEVAWAAGSDPLPARLFLPPLLADPGIFFLAAYRGASLVAGGILNISGEGAERVVGLSNIFAAPGEDARARWLDAADQAAQHAPGLPLVGYEHGETLAWAVEGGFAPLGPLRVWARA